MGSKPSSVSQSSELSVHDHIQHLIYQHPVMVFSKSDCPYSVAAKRTLSKYKLGKNYYVLELDRFPSKEDDYLQELGKLTGASTVPRVFINGRCVGGGQDIVALDRRGDLKRLLLEARAIVG